MTYTHFDPVLSSDPYTLTREQYWRYRTGDDETRARIERDAAAVDVVFRAVEQVTRVGRYEVAQRRTAHRTATARVLRARRLACRLLLDAGLPIDRVHSLTGSRNATVQANNADPVLLAECRELL